MAYDTDGTVDSYCFDFGDGTNSSWTSSPTAKHKYSKAGIYPIKAKSRDNNSTESDLSTTVTVQVDRKTEPTPSLGAVGMLAVMVAAALFLGRLRKG